MYRHPTGNYPPGSQVRQNKESQRLQYDVAERMRALGWKKWALRGSSGRVPKASISTGV